jgi:hypothetical protein
MHLFFCKHPLSPPLSAGLRGFSDVNGQSEISIKLFTVEGVISHKNMALVLGKKERLKAWREEELQQDTAALPRGIAFR